MNKGVVALVLFLLIPMVMLNPMGREAFLGYYAGILAMWLTFACVVEQRERTSE